VTARSVIARPATARPTRPATASGRGATDRGDASIPVDLVVLAKAPAPGRSKTRCTPPCTPEQAAELAAAALAETLATVQATPARRHVLVLDGEPGDWLPAGFEVLPQRGGGLDERLDAAMTDTFAGGGDAPALLIGMDTPQVSVALLADAAWRLAEGADAVVGPALDGGYWAVGLQRPADAFVGVPMSTSTTGEEQRRRLASLGLDVELLTELRDVDTWTDAVTIARSMPWTGFASAIERIGRRLDPPC
jgi:rSAM/selenodomain-associated transferase 1